MIEEKSSVCEKLEIEFIKLDELFGVEGKRKEKKNDTYISDRA